LIVTDDLCGPERTPGLLQCLCGNRYVAGTDVKGGEGSHLADGRIHAPGCVKVIDVQLIHHRLDQHRATGDARNGGRKGEDLLVFWVVPVCAEAVDLAID
jgi:hypothetical protein